MSRHETFPDNITTRGVNQVAIRVNTEPKERECRMVRIEEQVWMRTK